MNLRQMDYVIFDVETTGLSPSRGDRMIEIGAIKVCNGKEVDCFESFINPQQEIPIEAQQVNNISNEMVADAPKADEILPQMIDFIGGACLVAHNIKFDLEFLCCELSMAGRKLNEATPAVDTLKMSRRFLPQLRSHKLGLLAQSFGITFDETHRALADVRITLQVLSRLLNLADDQGIRSIADLVKEFGVTKPSYKIEKASQGLLF